VFDRDMSGRAQLSKGVASGGVPADVARVRQCGRGRLYKYVGKRAPLVNESTVIASSRWMPVSRVCVTGECALPWSSCTEHGFLPLLPCYYLSTTIIEHSR
jgi:hypothetical protein